MERAGQVLQHINGLYTVYTLLVLFDAQGRIVAVSDPARAELLGTQADPATVQATLGLRDPARHRVGPHAPSALYGGLPTYVYAAGVQAAGGAVLGGVAIVFDGAPQFSAMLSDALPRTPAGEPISGAIGLFVARNGSVLASTDPRVPAGSRLPLAASLPDLPRGSAGQRVVEWEGVHYAAGVSQGGGYREYRQGDPASPHDVAAIVLLRLGEALPLEKSIPTTFESTPRSGKASGSVTEIAGFTLGAQWFGLEATAVEEVIGPVTPVALPNAPGHVAGLVRHRGEVVPVIDPGMVLATGPAALDGPLLICRADHGQRIALRVDSLGTVFTVDAVQLVPWQPPAGGRKLRLLSGRSAGGSSMLTLLPVEALWSSGVSLPNFSGLDLGPESESESEFAPEPEPEPKPARRELRQTETIR